MERGGSHVVQVEVGTGATLKVVNVPAGEMLQVRGVPGLWFDPHTV